MSYTSAGVANKQDVTDFVINTTPDDVHLLNLFGNMAKPKNVKHTFLSDHLSPEKDNAELEGFTYAAAESPDVYALHNYSQIFKGGYKNTKSRQATEQYGIPDQKARDVKRATDELSRDIEKALLSSASCQPYIRATSQKGRMGGIHYFTGGWNTFTCTGDAGTNIISADSTGFSQDVTPFYTGCQVTLYATGTGKLFKNVEKNGMYYARMTDATGYAMTLHRTPADAQANTNIVALGDTGSGTLKITTANIVKGEGKFTEDLCNKLGTMINLNGGLREATIGIIHTSKARALRDFTGYETVARSPEYKTKGTSVSVYETDGGTVAFIKHRMQDPTRVDFIAQNRWNKGFIRPITAEDIPPGTDEVGKTLVCEMTCESLAHIYNGAAINVG